MKKRQSKSPPAIPTAIMNGWRRQAFQKPPAADHACPEPELVISAALEELPAAEERQVQDHMLTCRDCLELFLDVRLAQAEAAGEALQEGGAREDGWLAVVVSKIREALQAMGQPRRLIPALAAVSLAVCLVIFGRQESSRILPPPQLALNKQAAPPMPDSSGPAPAPRSAESHATARLFNMPPAEPEAETMASSAHKPAGAKRALSKPLRLNLTAGPGDGARLAYSANRRIYVYLLRRDQSGKINLLHSDRLEAGKTYYYPAKDHLLKANAGATSATVFLVASPKPVADLKTKLKKLERQGTDRIQDLFPGATIRSLSIKLP